MQLRYPLDIVSRLSLSSVGRRCWQQVFIWSSLILSNPVWAVPATLLANSGSEQQASNPDRVNQLTPESELQPVQQLSLQAVHPLTSPTPSTQIQGEVAFPFRHLQSPQYEPQPASLATARPTTVPNPDPGSISDLDLSVRSRKAADLIPSETPELVVDSSSIIRPAFDSASGPASTRQPDTPAIENSASPTQVAEQIEADPDLGILKLQEQPNPNPDNPLPGQVNPGQLPPTCEFPDPDLGCLRLKDAPLPTPPVPRAPVLYLLARLDFFKSSNIYSGIDPIDDGLFRPGISLYTVPPLGPDTYFVGSIDGNLVRYSTQKSINYDELRLRAGIMQRLSPTMFGEIGWANQQLFIRSNDIAGLSSGERFLNDHAIRLELNRQDQLGKRWRLNTFYQFRLSFSDPADRSRLSNALFLSLSYDILPNLQAGLDYQFVLVNFTQQKRDDQFHQLIARLSYTLFRNTQLNLFAGYSFGSSTDSMVDFDGSVLGVSLSTSLALF